MFARKELVSAAMKGPRQCGAERGAEVRGCVLQSTYLGAVLVRNGGDRHGPELRCESADPQTDEEHRDEDDLWAGIRIDAAEEHERSREKREEPELHDATG